jgi:hypothetical protein
VCHARADSRPALTKVALAHFPFDSPDSRVVIVHLCECIHWFLVLIKAQAVNNTKSLEDSAQFEETGFIVDSIDPYSVPYLFSSFMLFTGPCK